jgi:ribosomal protein L10
MSFILDKQKKDDSFYKLRRSFEKNKYEIDYISEKLNSSFAVLFFDHKSLSSNLMTNFRKESRKYNVSIKTVKNTLLNLSFEKVDLKNIFFSENFNFKNCNSLIFINESEEYYQFLKLMVKYLDQKFNFLLKINEKKVIDKEKINHLALLPTKNELINKLINYLQFNFFSLISLLNILIEEEKKIRK